MKRARHRKDPGRGLSSSDPSGHVVLGGVGGQPRLTWAMIRRAWASPSGQQHAQAGDATFELFELADVHHDRGEAQIVLEIGGAGSGGGYQHPVPAQRDDMAAAFFLRRADCREQPGRHQLRQQEERAVAT